MAPGSPGTSLLYGPPSRRTRLAGSSPARVEARLRALLAQEELPLDDLLAFLGDHQVPGGAELARLSAAAAPIVDVLGDPGLDDPLFGSDREMVRASADTFLFRAYHRLDPGCAGQLLDRRLADELRLGHGHEYLCKRIDRLLADSRVKRRCDTILLRRDDILGGVSYPTHLLHSSGAGLACRPGEGTGTGPWKPAGRARRPTCDECGRLSEGRSDRVARIPRKGSDELAIYGEDIQLRARAELAARLAEAPVAPEDRDEVWQRSLWDAWVTVMVRETRDMGGTSNLAEPDVRRHLRDFWNTRQSSIAGRMPNFTI